MNFERWLKQQIRELDTIGEFTPMVADDLRDIIHEAERIAAGAGLIEAVKACQIRGGGISPSLCRRVLTACLAACKAPESKPTLTPPQLAKEWGISPDKVLGWIRSGELRARNVSQGNRPRYLIDRETLESFRPPKDKPVKQRRRKTRGDVIEFY